MWSPRNRSPASPAAARAPRAATRSFVLDPAVSMVSLGPQGHHNRPTGDPCPLASGRLPSVLALEIPLPWRPATDRRGSARAHPPDQRGKSVVGSSAHSMASCSSSASRSLSLEAFVPRVHNRLADPGGADGAARRAMIRYALACDDFDAVMGQTYEV